MRTRYTLAGTMRRPQGDDAMKRFSIGLFAFTLLLAACGPSTPAAPTQAPPASPATAVPAAATAVSAAATAAPTLVAVAKPAATAVAAAAPTVAAAVPTIAAAASGTGSTINIYLYQKPKNWNPLAPPNGPDTQVETLIYDALLMVNDQYQYEPRLAQQWTVSPDARVSHSTCAAAYCGAMASHSPH